MLTFKNQLQEIKVIKWLIAAEIFPVRPAEQVFQTARGIMKSLLSFQEFSPGSRGSGVLVQEQQQEERAAFYFNIKTQSYGIKIELDSCFKLSI